MKAFKVKTTKSAQGKMTTFEGQVVGKSAKIQAVYYSSKSPSQHLMLYDREGDCFMFPIPGQVDNKVVTPEIPVTVQLPIHYYDELGDQEIIVFGEME